MADNQKNPNETETILMALDQISQTIDVMTSVVGRLRHYLQQQVMQGQPIFPAIHHHRVDRKATADHYQVTPQGPAMRCRLSKGPTIVHQVIKYHCDDKTKTTCQGDTKVQHLNTDKEQAVVQ